MATQRETDEYIRRREKQNADYLRQHGADPNGKGFVWGRIVKTHNIDDTYVIVEYIRRRADNVAVEDFVPGNSFHPYVKPPEGAEEYGDPFHDTGYGYGTLAEAVIATVAYREEWKNDDINAADNSRVSMYVMRILRGRE